jgi:UDP-N-acetylglucosamine 2-epimerase (non-hydrolysing)
MKIAVVLGTRPEIIKMAPVIKELLTREADFFVLHTGQHYSYRLDRVFFEQLRLPEPRYNLEAGSGSHAAETARMLVGIEEVLVPERPDIVLVEGDTNSVLAGALTAAKLGIRVGHVEAGLRSYDRRMPEEINRVVTDHISDFLFAPTDGARRILLDEGIENAKISVTGNTIVDAVRENLTLAGERGDVLADLKVRPQEYLLVTLHRQENVDDRARFAAILRGLEALAAETGMTALYPVHPRARARLDEMGLEPRLTLVEPVDYFGFLQLESGARLILTDSGGVQEEACILGVPCVTLRDNTERPETVAVGANVLAGAVPESILKNAREMLAAARRWENPFGDGRAAVRIVDAALGTK